MECIEHLEVLLKEKKHCIKALIMRSKAYKKLRDYDKAKKDVTIAYNLGCHEDLNLKRQIKELSVSFS